MAVDTDDVDDTETWRMIFQETRLQDVYLLSPERKSDARGYFARTWCIHEAQRRGVMRNWVQCSVSFNHLAGTLRGMHLQSVPHAEAKLVRCTRGMIFDVAVDLRPKSATYCQWFGTELSEDNGRQLFIPEGVAHGFLTLADASEVYYQISEFYEAESAIGIRWDDPAIGIQWPCAVRVIHPRDSHFPDFKPSFASEEVR